MAMILARASSSGHVVGVPMYGERDVETPVRHQERLPRFRSRFAHNLSLFHDDDRAALAFGFGVVGFQVSVCSHALP
jgi:hypothetical protein